MKCLVYWLFCFVFDILLSVIHYPLAVIISLFTTEGWSKWMALFVTYDNPPQGDGGWITKRSYFPQETTGFKGYLNRVGWLWRNPLYGFNRLVSVSEDDILRIDVIGDKDISDKYKRAGSYLATAYDSFGELVAFEYYLVKPITENKCIRIRIGWKLMTDKLQRLGFAPFVDTFHFWKQYGD